MLVIFTIGNAFCKACFPREGVFDNFDLNKADIGHCNRRATLPFHKPIVQH